MADVLAHHEAYRPFESCEIEIASPCCIVIFGGSGDLARRKLIPALYHLHRDSLLPDGFFVYGAARTAMDNGAFRELMRRSVEEAFPADFEKDEWERFSRLLNYGTLDYGNPDSFRVLREEITALERQYASPGNRIFYLAVPSAAAEMIIPNLGAAGLSEGGDGYAHVVIEKPIGHDIDSARELNRLLRRSFVERQIYRMDHYLAKETVQNILIFRFVNSIFEPLWNRTYIDHVQITVSETLGVGHRAGYYEKAGVFRDMFQNHIFQLLALTAMEAPSVFDSERVRDERVKVFRSVRPFALDRPGEFTVIGQYGRGSITGEEAAAYREEQGVDPRSLTPTYAALKVFIDNWRWNGVPFYLRSGKRLSKRKAEISVHFRPVPHLMLSPALEGGIEPNTLVLRVQPDEGISLFFQAKAPGSKICLSPVTMEFSYRKIFSLSDYERVLLDCMQGDQMLFVRDDGVEATWAFLTPLIEQLESDGSQTPLTSYAAGTEGPPEADTLLKRDGRTWRPL